MWVDNDDDTESVSLPSDRDWRETAVENRTRIRALEREVDGVRKRQHDFSEQLGVVNGLAVEVRNIAEDVKQLSEATQRLAREASQTVQRPTAAVIAQYLAVIVAVVALVLTLSSR